MLTTSNGSLRYTRSNSFGSYRFEELPVGETYVISVRSRRYSFVFDTRIITLMEDFSEADFTAFPN
jgi:hypothetical protein